MNSNLHKAKRNKNDEFYTPLDAIENELKHYKEHFRSKVVLCNCDDPLVSKFTQYFSYNFEHLGLKRLIATCYRNNQANLFSQNTQEEAIYLEYTGDKRGKRVPCIEDWEVKPLNGDGDFSSPECIQLMREADIVCTNPPFSLFRKYVTQLMEYDKQFLIIGSFNAVTYKDVFGLIKSNKLWLGCNPVKEFGLPNGGNQTFGNIVWFTNLTHNKRNEEFLLTKNYKGNEQCYPKYDNYDAIEVSKAANIPKDYYGAMGVPITFLDKHNPKQFEILGVANSARWIGYECLTIINSKRIYNRFIIKRRIP